MQGFPIGGSRIRLSWGRSQCRSIINLLNNCPNDWNVDKAAQAAAQAAQAAALQAHLQSQMISPRGTPITMEQTVQLLQRMQLTGFNPMAGGDAQGQQDQSQPQTAAPLNDEPLRNMVFSTRDINGTSSFGVQPSGGFCDMRTPRAGFSTSFSPFSPDPNLISGGDPTSKPAAPKRPESLLYFPASATDYVQGFGSAPALPHDLSNTMGADGKVTVPRSYASLFEEPYPYSRPPPPSLNISQEQQEYIDRLIQEEGITDFNGTLASLDLDSTHHHHSPPSAPASASTSAAWKTPGSSSPSA